LSSTIRVNGQLNFSHFKSEIEGEKRDFTGSELRANFGASEEAQIRVLYNDCFKVLLVERKDDLSVKIFLGSPQLEIHREGGRNGTST